AVAGLILSAALAPARADLHMTESVANAGVVYAGAPLVHEFTFENVGPETVTGLEARASCGCLRPTLAKQTYQAGEKGSVRLEIHTLSQAPGAHAWTVTLNYQTGNVPRTLSLQLNARLVAEVTVQPA